MRFSILTLNPGFFSGSLDEGMIRIAREKGLLEVEIVPIRDFTSDRYGTTDDYPYGGGAGMVMKAEPLARAVAPASSRSADVPGLRSAVGVWRAWPAGAGEPGHAAASWS